MWESEKKQTTTSPSSVFQQSETLNRNLTDDTKQEEGSFPGCSSMTKLPLQKVWKYRRLLVNVARNKEARKLSGDGLRN